MPGAAVARPQDASASTTPTPSIHAQATLRRFSGPRTLLACGCSPARPGWRGN